MFHGVKNGRTEIPPRSRRDFLRIRIWQNAQKRRKYKEKFLWKKFQKNVVISSEILYNNSCTCDLRAYSRADPGRLGESGFPARVGKGPPEADTPAYDPRKTRFPPDRGTHGIV